MKKLFFIALAGTMAFACQPKNQETEAQTEEVAVAEASADLSFYGEEITTDNAAELASLMDQVNPGDTVAVKVKGTINATCAMKGCWMNLDGPEGDVRVTFKDYGFFVPKEGMEGNEAIIEGIAVKSVTDVETLRHYAKDAGKSEEEIAAITEPQEGIAIIANGVAIRSVK
jgi:hypothetical protein